MELTERQREGGRGRGREVDRMRICGSEWETERVRQTVRGRDRQWERVGGGRRGWDRESWLERMIIYLSEWERERERERAKGRGRERERAKRKNNTLLNHINSSI